MQKACSKFIWRNRLERIALEQSHPKLTEGGLGLVILKHKCRALFSATLIKQFLGESSGTNFLNYWIGKALKGVKPNFVGLHSRETHALFSNAVNDILYVHETNPNTQWSSMNTKAFYCIYCLFIVLTRPQTPKINQWNQRFLPIILYPIQKSPYPTYPALSFPHPQGSTFF